ncbi:MAG: hypothetical protein Q9198_002515 [Flavoplaca austrocitrina]
MPFTSGIFNTDGFQPPPGTAAEIADAHNTLIKLIKVQYAAGTLNLEQINSYLFPFLKLDFLSPNWKPANEPARFSAPEIPRSVAIYPLDGNPLPMSVKEALISSMSPEEAEEFAQMIHIKQEEAFVGMDADLAEGPTTPQPSRSLSPVSSSTASSWVHVHHDGEETNIEPHSPNAHTQDPPSSPPTLVLDDYEGQEIEILDGPATEYDTRMQRACNEPQTQHDTESASSSTTFADSVYPQPPNSPIRDASPSPSTWGSATGEMGVESLASDHDEDEEEDDLDALCSPRDLACRVRAIVYPAIQHYKKNRELKLAKTLDALFMQGISQEFVLRLLDAVCSGMATVQQYADLKTCLHFHYGKIRMEGVSKRGASRYSMLTSTMDEEFGIKKTKFGLTQLKQVMVEFGTESRALECFEEKCYDVDDSDDSDRDSDREFPHQAIDELVTHRSKSF